MHSIRVQFASVALLVAFATALAFAGCGGDGDKDFCVANCPAVVAAGCTNGPTDQADCLTGCNSARTTCPTQFSSLAQCAGQAATFSCDANDSPIPVGCQAENEGLNACLQGISSFCIAVCPAVVAAGCSNGPPDQADCLAGCDEAETTCPSEFQAMAQCAGTSATFSCDANNSPYPDGCQAENDALIACL